MKVVLVHDYLNQYGGAERVLETLMEIFPEAPIYVSMHDPQRTLNRFSGKVKGTSFLDFPLARRHHRWFIPLMPLAAGTMTLNDDYDLIISDTAGFAKGVNLASSQDTRLTRQPIHIAYIHTPLRYAWETDTYFNNRFFKTIFSPVFKYLRWWDFRTAQRPKVLIANSRFIADKIKKYYNREARVIYPPVDTARFYYDNNYDDDKEYFLAVGRLLHYKRFDLIIDAFAQLGLPLKIVGNGPEYKKLEARITNHEVGNIKLMQFVENDDELRRLYNGAQAVIFPQVEDFGLVAAEAQACGTPVIAYDAGGAREIIADGETGVLFKEQTPESLAAAVKTFGSLDFNRVDISRRARRFSKENFQKQLLDVISQL